MPRTTKISKADQLEAIARLKAELKPGDNIYCRSSKFTGTGSKHIEVFLPTALEYTNASGKKIVKAHIWNCTFVVSKAIGYKCTDDDTIRTTEYASDIVGAIGRALYPNGVSTDEAGNGFNSANVQAAAATDGYYAFNLERI